jgi:hypothetical protein
MLIRHCDDPCCLAVNWTFLSIFELKGPERLIFTESNKFCFSLRFLVKSNVLYFEAAFWASLGLNVRVGAVKTYLGLTILFYR